MGTRAGAAAGTVAIALFALGALAVGERPAFDAPAVEVAADLRADRTRIQVACALFAAASALLVWFVATVATLSRAAGARARQAGTAVYGFGLVFVAVFLVDVTALSVAALRPENLAAVPELAVLLRDVELLAQGMASLVGAGLLAACAVLSLRHRALWPAWVGWLAALAAPAYALRLGTLFTVDGPFAADGVLGIAVPASALAGWIAVAGATLALRPAPAAAPR